MPEPRTTQTTDMYSPLGVSELKADHKNHNSLFGRDIYVTMVIEQIYQAHKSPGPHRVHGSMPSPGLESIWLEALMGVP